MFKVSIFTLILSLFAVLPINAQECMSMHVVLNIKAGYIDENGKLSGYHYDFLTALENESGICMDKKLLPYPRAKRDIQLGAHDGGILVHSPLLDDDIEYIAKIFTSKTVLIPRKGLNLNNFQDLPKVTIARIRKIDFSDTWENTPNISFVDVVDYKQGLQMLKRGRIDAIAGNLLGMNVVIESLDIAEDINLSGKLTIGEDEVWLVLSKKSHYLNEADVLRKATHNLIEKGVLNNIFLKYFGKNVNLAN